MKRKQKWKNYGKEINEQVSIVRIQFYNENLKYMQSEFSNSASQQN